MTVQLDNWFTARALLCQIDVLADTVGRLRRRNEDEYAEVLLERASFAVDALDAMLRPTAAELVRLGVQPPQALEHVDGQARKLRLVLCEPPR